ncbi:DUF2975 domain-containing protein [Hathewaya histolytica]|uniref:DUF2975 domain-containing protein n=1 Tax=Hathewaya histolytica TaxID=1498 RepID=A0A4U9RDS2_HATHI|nr:DUF2975 domain-containing protein [Hathewaya histolytica]VTQ89121.1 Uncharacterised protein [Hathewaya histolytica]
MKFYESKALSRTLGIILNIILVFGIVMTAIVYYNTFFINSKSLDGTWKPLMAIILTLGIVCIFLIVFELKKITCTLVKGNPFLWENVNSLNKISKYCFVISGCYFLNFIFNIGKGTYKFIYIDTKGIHTDTELIIFLLAGIFIAILSKIFKEAVKFKEENDYTI